MPSRPVASRLQEAAFALFSEQGYDATSVDQIAERAGVSRSTFFRTFPSKEAVVFPDHDEVLAGVEARLAAATEAQHFLAMKEAARLVLRHYLDEGDLARARYRLTRSVPALREREVAGMQRYQQAFRAFVRTWSSPPVGADDTSYTDDTAALRADLHAELLAGAVVTAHNLVLRRWLRGLTQRPEAEFDTVMAEVERLFSPREQGGGHVVVLGPGTGLDEALAAVRTALG